MKFNKLKERELQKNGTTRQYIDTYSLWRRCCTHLSLSLSGTNCSVISNESLIFVSSSKFLFPLTVSVNTSLGDSCLALFVTAKNSLSWTTTTNSHMQQRHFQRGCQRMKQQVFDDIVTSQYYIYHKRCNEQQLWLFTTSHSIQVSWKNMANLFDLIDVTQQLWCVHNEL